MPNRGLTPVYVQYRQCRNLNNREVCTTEVGVKHTHPVCMYTRTQKLPLSTDLDFFSRCSMTKSRAVGIATNKHSVTPDIICSDRSTCWLTVSSHTFSGTVSSSQASCWVLTFLTAFHTALLHLKPLPKAICHTLSPRRTPSLVSMSAHSDRQMGIRRSTPVSQCRLHGGTAGPPMSSKCGLYWCIEHPKALQIPSRCDKPTSTKFCRFARHTERIPGALQASS